MTSPHEQYDNNIIRQEESKVPIKAKTLHKTNTFESERFTSDNISIQPHTLPALPTAKDKYPRGEGSSDKKDKSFNNGTSVLDDVKKLIKQITYLYSV